MASFSDRLKELRKDKGVTQKALAEIMGMTEQAYQKYEYGMREPNHEATIKLADFFDVSVDYLLGRSDDETNIIISGRTKNVLSDTRLSLEAKGLYMQLRHYSMSNKIILPDEEKFLKEHKIARMKFDKMLVELQNLGYISDKSEQGEYALL